MATADFKTALTSTREVEITVTGRRSRHQISLPVWFVHEGDIAMEHVGIKVMHRLWFGKSLIKLVVPVQDPGAVPAPGGIQGGTGYRYWTMTIQNLDEVLSAVQAAGHKVVWPRREVRPGVVIGMVEDPDGNWVEFIQAP